ncbi:MAG: hypothetical protein CSA20_02215 [Deltaproteobacteria bacterium]|nr:MAG: hypothetical protein CSA20_02215 [Deltaproteobacteria bacterium]
MFLPPPDKHNIIDLLSRDLSAANEKNKNQFRFFSPLYDPVMKYFIRPRVHKADTAYHMRIWQELIGSVRQVKILDLACGTGGLITCLDNDNEYTGLDLSYEMLKKAAGRARKKGFARWCLVCANAEEQVFPGDSFDLVITDTALHIIPDWQGTIMAAARGLGPQGVFTGAVPVLGIDDAFDKGWSKYSSRPQFHALTSDDLQAACHANNLDYTCIATNGGMLYFQARKKKH